MDIRFYYGDDVYGVRQCVHAVIDFSGAGDFDMSHYGQVCERVTTDLRTPPFMSPDRVVVVWSSDLNALADVVESVSETADRAVLIVGCCGKPDKRKRGFKILKKLASDSAELALPKPWETAKITARVRELAQAKNINVDRETQTKLAELCGNDTTKISTELDKLANAFDDDLIHPETVAALVGGDVDHIFDLADYMLQGDTAQALATVRVMLNQHEPPIKIASILSGQFHLFLSVKMKISSANISPQRERFIAQKVRRIPFEFILDLFSKSNELMHKIKTGNADETDLELLTIALTTRR